MGDANSATKADGCGGEKYQKISRTSNVSDATNLATTQLPRIVLCMRARKKGRKEDRKKG
jgi:hypothetical protein